MIDDIHQDADTRMKKSVESVKVDLTRIRTGRATTALLDHVLVDYYGSDVPLNQAATVSVSDARTLSVQAWEKSMVPKIEKAIMESDLGLNPVTAGEIIRIPIPALTEERRREMTKIARQEGENGKIAIRNIRRDAGNHIRELTKEKEIGEDDEKKGLDKIQLLTDKYSTQLDELVKDKEADLMEV
jgi:ribosome recycling factor|tara:strand:+ start:1672 stop:2229 length:558 start_codon:yes stop_codon:yes gene_type:complete